VGAEDEASRTEGGKARSTTEGGKAQTRFARGAERGGSDPGGPDPGGPERGGLERGGLERGGVERGGSERGGSERGGRERAVLDGGGLDRAGSERAGWERTGSAREALARLAFALAVLLVVGAASAFIGSAEIRPGRVITALLRSDPQDPATALIHQIRLPRILLAALVGAALSLSGALLQAFFQNPMAGPYVVGVSAGAGLGAVCVLMSGVASAWWWVDPVSAGAFAGGAAVFLVVYSLSRRIRGAGSEGLLLVGIAVGSICSSITSVLLIFGRDWVQTALFWMMGSFAGAQWRHVAQMAVVLLISSPVALFWSRDLNLLLWGDEVALSLGSPVPRVRVVALAISTLLATTSVALCGVIGFVGLMVPHLARGYLLTVDHRFVLPGSMVIGAALAIAADALARGAMAPLELPVGAITSAIGAPFLIWLIVGRRRAARFRSS